MAVRLLPSIEKLLVAHLRASPDVTALASSRVGTILYDGKDPAIWLSIVAGTADWPGTHIARPVVDVRSYGGTKVQADTLARTVHAVMYAAVGTHTEGVVTAVDTVSLPIWLPDEADDPPRARYVATYSLVIHPNPT